jgi:hypothetical protein
VMPLHHAGLLKRRRMGRRRPGKYDFHWHLSAKHLL